MNEADGAVVEGVSIEYITDTIICLSFLIETGEIENRICWDRRNIF